MSDARHDPKGPNGGAPTPAETLTVEYDVRPRQAALRARLTALRGTIQLHRETAGEQALRRFEDQLDAVALRMDKPFNLVVVGEFKRGKSTLTNALAGMELVSTDVTPETVLVQELSFGETLDATLVLFDGGRVQLEPPPLSRSRVEELLGEFGDRISHLEFRAPSQHLQQFKLTDTPGTGDLLERFDDRVRSYLPDADAVLYVISALSPLSESERAFLELTLRPMELRKVTFVLNMVDNMRSSEETDRILQRTRRRLAESFPDSQVFPLSALELLSQSEGHSEPSGKRAAELRGYSDALMQHINEGVLLNRESTRLDMALRDSRAAVVELRQDAATLMSGLRSSKSELREELDSIKSRSSRADQSLRDLESALREAHLSAMKQGAGHLSGFAERLFQSLSVQLHDLDHETVQRHVPFFVNDRLRSAWTAVIESHRGTLIEHLQGAAVVGEDQLDPRSANAGFHPAELTGAAQVLVGLSMAFGFLAVSGFVARGLLAAVGAVDKDKGNQERALRFREHLNATLPELQAQLTESHSKACESLFQAAIQAATEQHLKEVQREQELAELAMSSHAAGESALEEKIETVRALQDLLLREEEALAGLAVPQ